MGYDIKLKPLKIKNMKDKKYTISNISEKQLKLISRSLELYTRLGLLQLERAVIEDVVWSDNFTYAKNANEIDLKFMEIRKLLVDKPGYENYGLSTWSFGIGNEKAPRNTDITYEMFNGINDILSPDRSNKGHLKFSKEEDIVVEDSDNRLNKIMTILKNLKDK